MTCAAMPVPAILQKFQLGLKQLEDLAIALHGHTPQHLGLNECHFVRHDGRHTCV